MTKSTHHPRRRTPRPSSPLSRARAARAPARVPTTLPGARADTTTLQPPVSGAGGGWGPAGDRAAGTRPPKPRGSFVPLRAIVSSMKRRWIPDSAHVCMYVPGLGIESREGVWPTRPLWAAGRLKPTHFRISQCGKGEPEFERRQQRDCLWPETPRDRSFPTFFTGSTRQLCRLDRRTPSAGSGGRRASRRAKRASSLATRSTLARSSAPRPRPRPAARQRAPGPYLRRGPGGQRARRRRRACACRNIRKGGS